MGRSEVLTAKVDGSVKQQIVQLAADRGVPVSELLNDIICDYLARLSGAPSV